MPHSTKQRHYFRYTWVDTQCNPSKAIPDAAQTALLYESQRSLECLFRTWCSSVCEHVGYMTREKRIPVVSFGCTLQRFSDKDLFPTFARTIVVLVNAEVGVC